MNTELRSELDTLLAADVAALDAREAALVSRIPDMSGGVCIYGGGPLGRHLLAGLRAAGVNVLAFIDRNASLWGSTIDDVAVKSLEAAGRDHSVQTPIIVGIFTAAATRERLRSQGFRVVSSSETFFRFPDTFLPHYAVDHFRSSVPHYGAIRRALALWDDETSQREYLAQVRYRVSLNERLPPSLPPESTYFPRDLVALRSDETYVDCGAFDGDSIRCFLRECNNSFRRIVALEPDPNNCDRLRRFADGLGAGQSDRIRVVQVAVSDRRKTVQFDASGTVGSRTDGLGQIQVDTASLDELLADESPTYIKMDIEGAEAAAVAGAARVIKQHLPVMAVSLYHRPEHLWEIPLAVHAIAPEYRLFLRRHSDDCWEQMLYAIPPDRVVR